jgi:DeoR/GlpR family transcriptional regulator of sugar metabolism
MRWAASQRQDFILATLQQAGRVNRADICTKFGVSKATASADLNAFHAAPSWLGSL